MKLRTGTVKTPKNGFARSLKRLLSDQSKPTTLKQKIRRTNRIFNFLLSNDIWMEEMSFEKFRLIVLKKVEELMQQPNLADSKHLQHNMSKIKLKILSEVRYDHDAVNSCTGYTLKDFQNMYGPNWEEFWLHSFSYPPETRYDTDGVLYTEEEFYCYYGKNYRDHWNNATKE